MSGPADMTLGDAMKWNWTWGCACAGGPNCCMRMEAQAERLKRAAHIVVKLLADHAAATRRDIYPT